MKGPPALTLDWVLLGIPADEGGGWEGETRAARFERRIQQDGKLLLPPEGLLRLRLAPGDLLALAADPEEGAAGVHLETYGEFFAEDWPAISPALRWRFLAEFLSRPRTAVEREGSIAIPEALFPLHRGDQVHLEIEEWGTFHRLVLRRLPREEGVP